MSKKVLKAVELIREKETYLQRRITANDTGETGSHQAGIYINEPAAREMFEDSVGKGANYEKTIIIEWADTGLSENCRFVFYGRGLTNNEFRITRVKRKLIVNDYLILIKEDKFKYVGFLLNELDNELFNVLKD